MGKITRRDFLKKAGLATAGVMAGSFGLSARSYSNIPGANDRVRIAVTGLNGRGKSHIASFMKLPHCEVAALCDVDGALTEERAREFTKNYGKQVKTVRDFRELLDDREIDAVSLATPNHWHAVQTVWACQAGKDVYVEKPATHNVWEGKKIIEAARKYNRIVQHGVQLRSSAALKEAVDHLNNGLIGRVYMARGLVFRWRPDIGDQGVSPVPERLDYDLWTGPAPMRPFTRNLVHYNWHWHWDYGNGDVGNQGIHQTDMCLWGLGLDSLPSEIGSMGGKYLWDDCKEVPEIQTTVYKYPKERKIIQFEVRNWCTNQEDDTGVGNIFYGDKGYMVIRGNDAYETYFGQKREPGPARREGGDHFANFIDAVRSRNAALLNGPVETGHTSSALAHLGNIAYRTGRILRFDPVDEVFVGDPEANRYLTREYREPYVMPQTV